MIWPSDIARILRRYLSPDEVEDLHRSNSPRLYTLYLFGVLLNCVDSYMHSFYTLRSYIHRIPVDESVELQAAATHVLFMIKSRKMYAWMALRQLLLIHHHDLPDQLPPPSHFAIIEPSDAVYLLSDDDTLQLWRQRLCLVHIEHTRSPLPYTMLAQFIYMWREHANKSDGVLANIVSGAALTLCYSPYPRSRADTDFLRNLFCSSNSLAPLTLLF
jgi:hypothetical protein